MEQLPITVDADVPGGNIAVEHVGRDEVVLRPDLRDTEGTWFYWHFRVRGASGQRLRFRLNQPNTLTHRGPAVSLDQGWTWRWLGAEACADWSFEYEVPAGVDDVRFSMGMPYTERNLTAFLDARREHPALCCAELCRSRRGRSVEMLRLGDLSGAACHRVLLTARHHCCEMMANYALERLIEFVLSDDAAGRWLREHVEMLVVPFVDKDGVEDGDQGKNRRPRDHNRDYNGESVHAETAALRELVPRWADGRLTAALDVHCPCLRGPSNEAIYLVGHPEPRVWEEQCRFGQLLETLRTGALPYRESDNLPSGQGWNSSSNWTQGTSCARWASTITGVRLATGIELPYAVASGVEVNQASARQFGADLARALHAYLSDSDTCRVQQHAFDR